jgi:uncharacterized membrane protein YraQ (UPF0718 family)
MSVAATIGHSLDEGFFMFWQTLWALVLGFVLSGVVQAFVSRRHMQRLMGDHSPAAIARSSALGMASSSCSYAASALARSLVGRGADFTAAMVFMVASTNLVIELGAVLWVLIGWQFAAAEFVGGAIMIAILAVALPRLIPAAMIRSARDRIAAETPADLNEGADGAERGTTIGEQLRRPRRWAAATDYAIADLTMLRREIVIGFIVAGFLAVGVPTGVWTSVFLHGHGAATTVENAVVGPPVAVVSFVCSIGNVPLAAALWQRGISFGGVIAFVFADLISLPLLLVYRRMYGGRLTLRLLGVFWAAMSLSGLLTQVVFRAVGAVPTTRPRLIAPEHFALDHTFVLDAVALIGLGALLLVRRQRDAARADDPRPAVPCSGCGTTVPTRA